MGLCGGWGKSFVLCVVSDKRKASEKRPEYRRAAVEVFLFLREQSCSFRFCFLALKNKKKKQKTPVVALLVFLGWGSIPCGVFAFQTAVHLI